MKRSCSPTYLLLLEGILVLPDNPVGTDPPELGAEILFSPGVCGSVIAVLSQNEVASG